MARRVTFAATASEALTGLRTRGLRSGLAALGIAIGIAALVAVVGISESSRADLLRSLDRLGTNLLTVMPGESFFGEESELPKRSARMIERIGPVEHVSAVRSVSAVVRRNHGISDLETGGIGVTAVDLDLLATLRGAMDEGRFLNEATARYPSVVLGSVAAQRLGIDDLSGQVRVLIDDRWFTVVGILEPMPLAPEIERSALIGAASARRYLDSANAISRLYVRSEPDFVEDVRAVLAATANPQRPEEVQVSRPSDALEARAAAKATFTSLLLGLGAIALLVSALGIANVMVVSVLERRSEIGLRRALGATKANIRNQFLAEAVALGGGGGMGGIVLGLGITAAYAARSGTGVAMPLGWLAISTALALTVGAIAGLYPAIKAAGLSPTDALRTT